MRVNDLKSPKKLIIACLAVFVLMLYFGQNKPTEPVILRGTVSGLQEQDGVLRAVGVDSEGVRYAVKITGQYLLQHAPPALQENQEVEMKVTSFKAVKQGINCEFVELIKAGPVSASKDADSSAPKGNAPLPVDDLKGSLGFKGM